MNLDEDEKYKNIIRKNILDSIHLTNKTKHLYNANLNLIFNNLTLKQLLNEPDNVIDLLENKYSFNTFRNILIILTAVYKYNTRLLKDYRLTFNIYRNKLVELFYL